jgi:pimeloyl-ACP methyl ester carboxylesterase
MTFYHTIRHSQLQGSESSATRTLASTLLLLVLAQTGLGQPPNQTQSPQDRSRTANENGEVWVGWLETKAQNLRLILRISSSAVASPSGSISSPDQTPDALPITQASIQNGKLEFEVNPPGIGTAAYAFQGEFVQGSLQGELEQAGTKLPISFTKATQPLVEGNERLGADSAWVGSLDVGTRKVPLRFRVYISPPYATPDSPRILFDSLLEKANGFPVNVTATNEGKFEFQIPAIPGKAKYIANLSADRSTLSGKFQQGFLPLQLDMTRIAELAEKQGSDKQGSQDALVQVLNRIAKLESDSKAEVPKQDLVAIADTPKQADSVKMPSASTKQTPEEKDSVARTPPPPTPGLPDGLTEQSFVVERLDTGKPRLNALGKKADNRFELSGTITYPQGFNKDSNSPAVILISGSGPQDRDQTIGRHKPFLEIAHYLASKGMVVLRYDDRGIGQSTGDFLNATTNDLAEDAVAVWQFAREISGVDRARVGALGHSEGGIIGPLVAAWQREVAFLILLAPPGLSGGEVLSSQIDRMAQIQGVGEEQRAVALSLQLELQRIALKYSSNDEAALSEVRKAVVERWDGLNRFSSTSGRSIDDIAMKKQVIDQVSEQFKGLQSPWMRHFLAYDPSSNWVLFDAPVLALWGEKDTQVLPEMNREKLEEIAIHNTSMQADFAILPGLNHLFQACRTGLPDEYDSIAEAINPNTLEIIGNWLMEREILP